MDLLDSSSVEEIVKVVSMRKKYLRSGLRIDLPHCFTRHGGRISAEL
jgi:hypothetical protein